MKKVIVLAVLLALLVSNVLPVFASEFSSMADFSIEESESVQEIIADYNVKRMSLAFAQANNSNARAVAEYAENPEAIEELRGETVRKLSALGCEVYEINSDNYDDAEKKLNTDLSYFGLKRGSSYLLVVGDTEDSNGLTRKTTGNFFKFTYDNQQYTLRTVTVTAADYDYYGQASTVDLMTSRTKTFIENLLNEAIILYATKAGVPAGIGTFASLTGLKLVNLPSSNKSSAIFYGNSNWTRVFTQVWDDQYQQWTAGSVVEYVQQSCCIRGYKYEPTTNRYEKYDGEEKYSKVYSENYGNTKWRYENAIVAYRGAFPQIMDRTGDSVFKVGSKIVIRHKGDFS